MNARCVSLFLLIWALAAISAGQVLTTIAVFDGTNGSSPLAGLIQADDGNFYGTTSKGGATGYGTVFKVTPSGGLTTLHSFASATDGAIPSGSLVQAPDHNFYGTASGGGYYGPGSVFRISPTGLFTVLHSFQGVDGYGPSGLLQGADGNFYGTTLEGGTGFNPAGGSLGAGTVFAMTATGSLTILHDFAFADGFQPDAPLVQAIDGNYYGTTGYGGGTNSAGTIFRITQAGVLTTLYSFKATGDGGQPHAALIQAADGNFYGTTAAINGPGGGTIFKVSSAGVLTTLHSFSGADGSSPYAGLVQATDGNLYGTTIAGGAYNLGTIFRITPSGTFTSLYSFFGANDGAMPQTPLIQASDGNLYGTASAGGLNSQGVVFKFHLNPVPGITSVQNAEGGSPAIAPNTWVTIKGTNLAPAGDSRIWQTSDFVSNQMPTKLDGVSLTMNGESAFVYYISPSQINVLTPPDLVAGPVEVVVTTGVGTSDPFSVQVQGESPSFFMFGAGPYVAATHADGSLIGPPTLYPGQSTPARPAESIIVYANGFGPTSAFLVNGSITQSGTLSPLPSVAIGIKPAVVQFAGLISPGLYQFNVIVPAGAASGDNAITGVYDGLSTQAGAQITIGP